LGTRYCFIRLFIANCDFWEETSCKANNDFNIDFEDDAADVKQEIRVEILVEDENVNIDSIVDLGLADIEMEGNIDTVIKIDLGEETTE